MRLPKDELQNGDCRIQRSRCGHCRCTCCARKMRSEDALAGSFTTVWGSISHLVLVQWRMPVSPTLSSTPRDTAPDCREAPGQCVFAPHLACAAGAATMPATTSLNSAIAVLQFVFRQPHFLMPAVPAFFR